MPSSTLRIRQRSLGGVSVRILCGFDQGCNRVKIPAVAVNLWSGLIPCGGSGSQLGLFSRIMATRSRSAHRTAVSRSRKPPRALNSSAPVSMNWTSQP